MALAKRRLKNVGATRIKLSKVKAIKFKKSALKASSMDMEVVQEIVENMDVDDSNKVKLPKKLTKKQYLRKQRKADMRKCLAAKRSKSKPITAEATTEAFVEEEAIVPQKVNNERLRKDELPIQMPSKLKQKQLKVREKELAVSNVVSGRRMSKKKARKITNAVKRDERERARKAAQMDTN